MERVARDVSGPEDTKRLDNVAHLVNSAYLGVLKREAEPRGLELYGHALLSGMTQAQLIEELIAMPEFQQARGQRPQERQRDTGSADLGRVADAVEKALLTLAVAAGRDKRLHGSPQGAASFPQP